MQIKQQFTVPFPRDQVWEYFGNVGEVTTCMPGATLREPPEGNQVKFQLDVKLGPIAAAFAGDADLDRDDASYRGVLQGRGRDKRSGSQAKGEVVYQLTEENGGQATRVDVTVDYSLAGSLAQFGRGGIVNDLASRLTAQFAENLEASLADSSQTDSAGAAAGDSSGAGPADRKPAVELDAGGLLLSVLWGRIRRFFARLFGRRG